jgi:hypothetical protein
MPAELAKFLTTSVENAGGKFTAGVTVTNVNLGKM